METRQLIEFPCEFPVKVMGRRGDEFRSAVYAIFERHMGVDAFQRVEERSSGENFVGLTFYLQAQSQAQLDAVYQDLSNCPSVLVAL